jgi:osmoprotectant transport system substrate-binding protein
VKKLLILLCLSLLTLPSLAQESAPPIRVGSKLFTGDVILGNIAYLALQEAGYEVVDALKTGNTSATRAALLNGQIDLYVEYTGTALSVFFPDIDPTIDQEDWQSVYATVASYDSAFNDLVWLESAPYSDSYVLVVTSDFAQQHNISTMSDLARYVNEGGQVMLASDEEFANRSDGLRAFESAYGFDILGSQMIVVSQLDNETFVQALLSGVNGINIIVSNAVDSLIYEYNLVALDDDRRILLPYEPAPVIRGPVLRRHPQIVTVLNPVLRALDGDTMVELVARVELDGLTPREAAQEYLASYRERRLQVLEELRRAAEEERAALEALDSEEAPQETEEETTEQGSGS